MSRTHFPDPRQSDENGLLCYGGTLEPSLILEAYGLGIFPWPHEGMPLLWFSPKRRGIIDFSELHVPRRLQQTFRTQGKLWRFSWNTDFRAVILGCAKALRKGEAGTWIHSEIVEAYCELHRLGHAHSLEIWNDKLLVGGIYGIFQGGVFSGESMFASAPNASKIAFIYIVHHLENAGLTWMDTQMVSPVTGTLGAKEVSQDEFLKRLSSARRGPARDLSTVIPELRYSFVRESL